MFYRKWWWFKYSINLISCIIQWESREKLSRICSSQQESSNIYKKNISRPSLLFSTNLHQSTWSSTNLHCCLSIYTIHHTFPPTSTILHRCSSFYTIYHPFPPTSTTNHQFTPFITLFHRPPPSSTAVHHSTPFITFSHQPPPSSTAVHNSTPFITLSHQSPPSSTTNHHFTLSITLFYHPPPLLIILHHLSHFSTLLPHWSSFYTIYSIVHMYGNWHKSWNEPQFPLIWSLTEYFSQLSICMVIDISLKMSLK